MGDEPQCDCGGTGGGGTGQRQDSKKVPKALAKGNRARPQQESEQLSPGWDPRQLVGCSDFQTQSLSPGCLHPPPTPLDLGGVETQAGPLPSGLNDIHNVVQPSPQSISKTFSSKQKFCPL